ncbi:MAG: flavin reductase family protein [Clostridiales bacterium]|nr:flavin reductase family protein [Clostridiales bacterium]
MSKVSVAVTNDICPQTMFVYGTYKEDGQPNFGLFCWFSYCWYDDLGVMCAIGGRKTTQERILANRVFSANLVVERNLPLADYFGTADGHDADKMNVDAAWEKGAVLDVPVLSSSPLTFELEVDKVISTNDKEGDTVFLCRIRNVLKDTELVDSGLSVQELMRKVGAVSTTGTMDYWSWDGRHLGAWHEPAQKIKPGTKVGQAAQM